jgi:hypothetical protein
MWKTVLIASNVLMLVFSVGDLLGTERVRRLEAVWLSRTGNLLRSWIRAAKRSPRIWMLGAHILLWCLLVLLAVIVVVYATLNERFISREVAWIASGVISIVGSVLLLSHLKSSEVAEFLAANECYVEVKYLIEFRDIVEDSSPGIGLVITMVVAGSFILLGLPLSIVVRSIQLLVGFAGWLIFWGIRKSSGKRMESQIGM